MAKIFRPFSTNGVVRKRPFGLGDAIERIVKPIAIAMKSKCLSEDKQLKENTPCAKRRDKLNKAGRFIGLGKTNQ